MFQFLKSSVGKKYIMAVTGLPLILFVMGHMLGNLQIYLGSETLNSYAEKIHHLGPFLWLIRGALLFIFVLHVVTAISLTIDNKKARPIAYENPATVQASVASRTMIISGLLLLIFIVFHIMHFTLRITDSSLANLTLPNGNYDVYRMVVLGFTNITSAILYIVSMALLAFHLYHGASSWCQSLGINNPKYNRMISLIGPVLALIVFLANSSIPLSILLKWVR